MGLNCGGDMRPEKGVSEELNTRGLLLRRHSPQFVFVPTISELQYGRENDYL